MNISIKHSAKPRPIRDMPAGTVFRSYPSGHLCLVITSAISQPRLIPAVRLGYISSSDPNHLPEMDLTHFTEHDTGYPVEAKLEITI